MTEELIEVTEENEIKNDVIAMYDDKWSVCWKITAIGVLFGILILFFMSWGQRTPLEYDKTAEGIVEGNILTYTINGHEFTKDAVEYKDDTKCTILLRYGGEVLSVMPSEEFNTIKSSNADLMMRFGGYSFVVFAITFIGCILMFMKDRKIRLEYLTSLN